MASGVDRARVARAVRELLRATGQDPDSVELAGTPDRVAAAYSEFFAGVGVDPIALLSDAMPVTAATGEIVVVRDIALRSICEHHLLPFRGRAHIAYRPGTRVAGFGTLPRVVEVIAARPQLQERLGEQIAEAIAAGLDAEGVLVIIEASHSCVADRGVRQPDTTALTLASRGVFARSAARAEVFALLGLSASMER